MMRLPIVRTAAVEHLKQTIYRHPLERVVDREFLVTASDVDAINYVENLLSAIFVYNQTFDGITNMGLHTWSY